MANVVHHRFDRRLPGLRAAGKVLFDHLINNSDFEAQWRPCAHSR